MAIYHFTAKIISRSGGRSSIASAAYRAAEKMTSAYDGITSDYTKKKGVVHSEIMLPANAPADYMDRSTLWNSVETCEKSKNAQTAREIEIALPIELSRDENILLVKDYVNKNFVDKGMCADVCVHDKNDGNPHAHIMLTMRPIKEDGTWEAKSKKIYVLDENGEKIYDKIKKTYKCHTVKTTNWDEPDTFNNWRQSWTDMVNHELERIGVDERIDHRSYEERGIYRLPTEHLGPYASSLEKRNVPTELGDKNRNIIQLNTQIDAISSSIQNLNTQIVNFSTYKERVQQLKTDIDNAIENTLNFTDFISQMRSLGYLVKQGKYIAFCPAQSENENEKLRFIRSKILGEQYTEASILLRLSNRYEQEDPVFATANKVISAHPASEVKLLIDVKNNIKISQSKAYEHWAAHANLERSVETLNYLARNGIWTYEQLTESVTRSRQSYLFDSRDSINGLDKEKSLLIAQKNTTELYFSTKPVYDTYVKITSKRDKVKYYNFHQIEINQHETVKEDIKQYVINGKVRSAETLRNDIKKINVNMEKLYQERNTLKENMTDLDRINKNVKRILDIDKPISKSNDLGLA